MKRAKEDRIRVLSVIDGLGFAGDENRLLNMSRGLDRERFHHSVLTLNPLTYGPADEYQARREQFLKAGIQVDDLAEIAPERNGSTPMLPARLHAKTGILRRARRLARTVREWEVDVIDARLESAGLVGAIAGQLSRTPASITLYGGHTPANAVTWPWTTRLALRLTTTVITDSRIRAGQMRTLLGKRGSKVLVIPNGIERPESDRSPFQMRELLRLPKDPRIRIIGMIGRLIEYKGHEVLIHAAKKVLAREPDVAFLCVGYTRRKTYKDHLIALTQQLGISDRVVITEYQGDIGDVWKAIDVHAHASLFDSLPISIAEGMSLGKPVAVTDVGGIPEMVLHGETGLIVPAGDAEALSGALLQLLHDTSLARRLGENAKARYERLYRPEAMVRTIEDHFVRLATKCSCESTRRQFRKSG